MKSMHLLAVTLLLASTQATHLVKKTHIRAETGADSARIAPGPKLQTYMNFMNTILEKNQMLYQRKSGPKKKDDAEKEGKNKEAFQYPNVLQAGKTQATAVKAQYQRREPVIVKDEKKDEEKKPEKKKEDEKEEEKKDQGEKEVGPPPVPANVISAGKTQAAAKAAQFKQTPLTAPKEEGNDDKTEDKKEEKKEEKKSQGKEEKAEEGKEEVKAETKGKQEAESLAEEAKEEEGDGKKKEELELPFAGANVVTAGKRQAAAVKEQFKKVEPAAPKKEGKKGDKGGEEAKAGAIKVGSDIVSTEGLPAEGKKEVAAKPVAPKKEGTLAQKDKSMRRKIALEQQQSANGLVEAHDYEPINLVSSYKETDKQEIDERQAELKKMIAEGIIDGPAKSTEGKSDNSLAESGETEKPTAPVAPVAGTSTPALPAPVAVPVSLAATSVQARPAPAPRAASPSIARALSQQERTSEQGHRPTPSSPPNLVGTAADTQQDLGELIGNLDDSLLGKAMGKLANTY